MRINLDKSSILLVGDVGNLDLLALELGCKVGYLPTTYLGLPLGVRHKSTMVWDAVEEKFWKRPALWKRQYISKEGRLALIRSTLSCMRTYLMSLLKIPKSISMRLERIQREFLWGGGALDRKIHNVNWKIVSSRRDRGGLGIRKLSSLNKALLGKWCWRFGAEVEGLWKTIIRIKYGAKEGGWLTKTVRGSFGVGLWKEIYKESFSIKQHNNLILGDGSRIKFWEDAWCSEEPFSMLYTMSGSKRASVKEV